MPMKIYITRHGETEWNRLNKVIGLTDMELTEKGVSQAEALADRLSSCGIDLIIASPLKRAYETARISAERYGIPLISDVRLIEQNYGIYEGADRKDPRFLANKRNFAYRYPDGESMMQVGHRVYSLIEEIREKYADKTVLLVSHGGVCRVIRTYFTDMSNEEFTAYSMENCALEMFEL